MQFLTFKMKTNVRIPYTVYRIYPKCIQYNCKTNVCVTEFSIAKQSQLNNIFLKLKSSIYLTCEISQKRKIGMDKNYETHLFQPYDYINFVYTRWKRKNKKYFNDAYDSDISWYIFKFYSKEKYA